MVSLKETFKLCRIGDDEVIYLCPSTEQRPHLWCQPMTGKEIREKYDMRATMVTEIAPEFCCGDYEGFLFTIKKEDA